MLSTTQRSKTISKTCFSAHVAVVLWALLPLTVEAQTPSFADMSATLPVAHVYNGGWEHFVGGGVAVTDCNDDGKPDFVVAGGENPARLFINAIDSRGWHFKLGDFPQETGVTGIYPLDIDSDGHPDLVVLRVGENRLYRGLGNCRFREASAEFGFVSDDRWTTAFSATWEPGQSLPTLAFGNYVDRKDPNGPFEACDDNQIYRPAGKRYTDAHILTPGFCALSMLFSDWSRTGHRDLRISNDRHYYVHGGHEQMWRLDEGRFLGAADGWKSISIWGMGIASQDFTGDRKPEVVLTSMGDQLMQLSSAHGYVAAPYSIGTYAQRPFLGDDGRPSTGWHAQFADVNNDGLSDLFIAKGNVDQMPTNAMKDPNDLLIQGPAGHFTEMADRAGVASVARSRGAALEDFDGDGRLDLVVVNRRAPLELYRNVTKGAANWVGLLVRQPAPNRNAIGGWIELSSAAHGLRTQELTVGGGHASGQLGPIHFGLGADTGAKLRIRWPDRSVSNWYPINANRVLTVARGPGKTLQISTSPHSAR